MGMDRCVAGRQLEEKRCAAPLVRPVSDRAAVRLDDAVAHRKSEARALADRLRGEERLEQLGFVLGADARTVVEDLEAYFATRVGQADQDPPFLSSGRFD